MPGNFNNIRRKCLVNNSDIIWSEIILSCMFCLVLLHQRALCTGSGEIYIIKSYAI